MDHVMRKLQTYPLNDFSDMSTSLEIRWKICACKHYKHAAPRSLLSFAWCVFSRRRFQKSQIQHMMVDILYEWDLFYDTTSKIILGFTVFVFIVNLTCSVICQRALLAIITPIKLSCPRLLLSFCRNFINVEEISIMLHMCLQREIQSR